MTSELRCRWRTQAATVQMSSLVDKENARRRAGSRYRSRCYTLCSTVHERHGQTSSSAVTERPRDTLCPSVVSLNKIITRADSFIIGRPGRFYSMVQKWVFRPAGATRCRDKREIWHGVADRRSAPQCQISRLSGRKCGNTVPKTVKISTFGQKFVHQGRLVCNIFYEISSVCTRL